MKPTVNQMCRVAYTFKNWIKACMEKLLIPKADMHTIDIYNL